MAKKNSKYQVGSGTAKATTKLMSIRECVKLYTKYGTYASPRYQRPFDAAKASQILAYFIYLVCMFDVKNLPALGTIIIREGKITIQDLIKTCMEFVDGQHRMACIYRIIKCKDEAAVKVPYETTNREIEGVCKQYGGKTFADLDEDMQEAILNLCYVVINLDCEENVARAIFAAVNETKTIGSNDKTRCNYCDSPMYQAMDKIKKATSKKSGLSHETFKSTIYRLMAVEAGLVDMNATMRPGILNPQVLKRYSNLQEKTAIARVNTYATEAADVFSSVCPDKHNFFHVRNAVFFIYHKKPKNVQKAILDYIKADQRKFASYVMSKLVDEPHIGDTYHKLSVTQKAISVVEKYLKQGGVL